MSAAGTTGMDLKLLVFNAAKDGKLKKLKIYLSSKTSSEVKELISAETNGSTPLIVASRNGRTEVVSFLISKCKANMEQCGSVTFDGETIEGAPPLWCAAAAGHMAVVKCLVQNKANSNSTTLTNSTPLRAACFDGHLGIVKYLLESKADVEIANRHGHTCLMIACYKGHKEIVKALLEVGADVNRRSAKGNTALHDCAESGSLEIIRLLLRHGARMQKDGYGMTPILAASITGHRHVVEYLISRTEISLKEQIHALELLGATFVDKYQERTTAYSLWSRALILRSSVDPIPKPCRDPVKAFCMAVEAQTKEELDEIRSDPQSMRMQALLVRERILGPKHPDTSYYIRYRGAVFADAGDFNRCIALWMYALDMQQSNLDPLSPMTLSSLLSFAELFSFMQKDQVHVRMQVPKATHSQILEVLKRAINEIEHGAFAAILISSKTQDAPIQSRMSEKEQDKATSNSPESRLEQSRNEDNPRLIRNSTIHSAHQQRTQHGASSGNSQQCCGICEASGQRMYRVMGIALHLLALSNLVSGGNLDDPAAHENELLEKATLLNSVKNVVDHKKRTMLHLSAGFDACPLGRYPVTTFPSSDVVKTLLKCGYNPNALDCDGNSPIHIASTAVKRTGNSAESGGDLCDTVKNALEIISALVERNGHIDYRNYHGLIPIEILPKSVQSRVNFVKFESLKCLAARAVVVNRMHYHDHMPKSMWNFIANH